jgi:hypothetical protein
MYRDMNIIDFSATKTREPVKHHAALPNSIRAIIIGPSGSGKTQLLLNLIMRWMKWDKLYLIAPSVDDQKCYEVLKDFNENASEIAGEDVIEFITDIDEAPSVEDLDGSINNMVVYDDVMLDKQKNPARIFSRGRHKNTDVIYVTQRYTQIPKVIRDNCNVLCVFNGVDTHTLRNIWQTWCSDMDFNQFRNFFSHAQSAPHGFVTINLHDPRTRYRIGLDQIFG